MRPGVPLLGADIAVSVHLLGYETAVVGGRGLAATVVDGGIPFEMLRTGGPLRLDFCGSMANSVSLDGPSNR